MSRVAEKRRGEEDVKQGGKRESSDKENSQHNTDGAGSPRKKVTGVKTTGESKAGEQIQHLALEEEQGGVRENQLARSGEALNTSNKKSTICRSVSLDYYFLL